MPALNIDADLLTTWKKQQRRSNFEQQPAPERRIEVPSALIEDERTIQLSF
jgi:hypothetical protein